MRIFWKKCKKLLEASPPDPRVVTPAYYFNFVKFIFSTKCSLLSLNEGQFLLLPNFCTYFSV